MTEKELIEALTEKGYFKDKEPHKRGPILVVSKNIPIKK